MGIRESLTLTWQDLDQSPLSLFTYCEEAMATKPNTNLSTARLWNANTQATYHRMMEKMQALYYHLRRFAVPTQQGFRVLSSSTGSVYVVIYST